MGNYGVDMQQTQRRSKVAVDAAGVYVPAMLARVAATLCMRDLSKSFSSQTSAAHRTSNYCPAKVREGH